jgi:NADH:ubiquinone oxidoreductase subunit 5 (subunit L)/multisubunit Na+/H+ antiporter MnhA subunit
MESHIHHSQNASVTTELGAIPDEGVVPGIATVNAYAHAYHGLAGNLALGIVLLGIVFAYVLYYLQLMDPAEGKKQFPALHRFLWHKWYFDEVYQAVFVNGSLLLAQFLSAFDKYIVDGIVNLDCTGLEYISSAGIAVIMQTYKRLLGAGHSLRLENLPCADNSFFSDGSHLHLRPVMHGNEQ